MNTLTKKKSIRICIIGATLFLVAAVLFILLFPWKPDPYALLEKAEGRIAQNLCRLAILEEDPMDEEVRTALLTDYQQNADPLTLYSAQQQAEAILGHPVSLPEGVLAAPTVSAPLPEGGDIAQMGVTLKKFKEADGLASDGTIVYLSTEKGIYANYKGLQRKIFPVKAQSMIAAEEGLYFINLAERKVQYLAGDGSYIATLSSRKAADFAFLDGVLYLLDQEGRLWQGDTLLDAPMLTELCATAGALYGCAEHGLYLIHPDDAAEQITTSSLSDLTAGEDGKLYYLNEYRYPCRLNPEKRETTILKEKEVISIGQTNQKVYYLDQKGKIRKI